eukprot:GABV01000861.1.p3 GENE.GABV01000861.1~~GABV01000861.1.p3  ORF type:complete len:136 (-),score=63.31 GABV01000861.1:37-444(-)
MRARSNFVSSSLLDKAKGELAEVGNRIEDRGVYEFFMDNEFWAAGGDFDADGKHDPDIWSTFSKHVPVFVTIVVEKTGDKDIQGWFDSQKGKNGFFEDELVPGLPKLGFDYGCCWHFVVGRGRRVFVGATTKASG